MLKDILAISGHSGLFKFISQGRSGIIVESLDTKKRMNASATAKISTLEDISIYTDSGEVSLKDIFKAIFDKEEGRETISHKASNDELQSYFEAIVPDYDRDRVYVSDIKKVARWYNILHSYDMLNFEEEEAAEKENKEQEENSDAEDSTSENNQEDKQ